MNRLALSRPNDGLRRTSSEMSNFPAHGHVEALIPETGLPPFCARAALFTSQVEITPGAG